MPKSDVSNLKLGERRRVKHRKGTRAQAKAPAPTPKPDTSSVKLGQVLKNGKQEARQLKRLQQATVTSGHALAKMRAAQKKTITSASRRASVNSAIEACEAVVEYAKDLETRIAFTAKRYANYEALAKLNYELLQKLEEFEGDRPQTLRATRNARMRFWTQPNSRLKRAYLIVPRETPQN